MPLRIIPPSFLKCLLDQMTADPFCDRRINDRKNKQPESIKLLQANRHTHRCDTVYNTKRTVYKTSVGEFPLLPCCKNRLQYPPAKGVNKKQPQQFISGKLMHAFLHFLCLLHIYRIKYCYFTIFPAGIQITPVPEENTSNTGVIALCKILCYIIKAKAVRFVSLHTNCYPVSAPPVYVFAFLFFKTENNRLMIRMKIKSTTPVAINASL